MPGQAVPMHTVDGIHWTAEVEIGLPETKEIHYSYHVYRDGQAVRNEWNSLPRVLYVSDDPAKTYRLEDSWKNLPEQQYFYKIGRASCRERV